MSEVYEIKFDCNECAEDGQCMVYGHPCSSIYCTEKDDQSKNIKKEEKIMFDNKNPIQLWGNDQKRKAFLEAYKEWGLWFETPELELKYYRYQLPNGTTIIVQEHNHRVYETYQKHRWDRGVFYYVQKPDEPAFSPDFKQRLSYAADMLKDAKIAMQKTNAEGVM